MKNIKTSKVVALVLSLAMLLNVFAGLSLTSFAAGEVTVGMYFMDHNNGNATPTTFTAGQSYTAVVYLRNYNAENAATYPISGLQIDTVLDSNFTVDYVNTYEVSGYQFDGTTDFATQQTDEDGNTIVRFASTYGSANDAGEFTYSTLASSDADIEIYGFVFTISETATGTISLPMTVIAADSAMTQHTFVVDSRSIQIVSASSTTDISVYGPDLEAINGSGTYNIDDATAADGTGYTPFGTSWTAAGFAEGSSVVRLGYDNYVYLGSYDFTGVTKIKITYHTDGTLVAANNAVSDAYYSIGLAKTAASFGWDTKTPDFTNAIAYGAISDGANGWPAARTLTITEGIDTTYSGDTWLTTYACNGQVIAVTGITLYYGTEDETEVTFDFNTDAIYADGVQVTATGIGGTSKFVWSKYGHLPTITITDNLNFVGWCITAQGVGAYEYSVDGGDWTDANAVIGERSDLSERVGYETAAFNITIPAAALTVGASNTVDIRIVDGAGNTAEMIQFTIKCEEPPYSAFHSNVDFYYADGVSTQLTGVGGIGKLASVSDTITVSSSVGFAGWCTTTNGTAGYEYSLDGSTWTAVTECSLSSRSDLLNENLNISYNDGYATAGFNITISAAAFAEGTNTLVIRGVDTEGNTYEVLEATVVYEPEEVVDPTTYTITVGTVENGTVTTDPTGTVEEGTTVTVTATPNDGYELTAILVNGEAIDGNTFTVTADAEVTATFTATAVTPETYTITVVTGGKGTGTVTVVESAEAGATVTLTATGTPNDSGLACVTTAITSDDVTLTTTTAATGAYTGASFTMPAANVTITVNFQILGDATLDGRINVQDTRAVKSHASRETLLTGEKLIVANVSGATSATVNVADTRSVKSVASKETTVFPNGSY